MKSQAKGRLNAYLAQLQARRAAAGSQSGSAPPLLPPGSELAATAPAPVELQQQRHEAHADSYAQQHHVGATQLEQQQQEAAAAAPHPEEQAPAGQHPQLHASNTQLNGQPFQEQQEAKVVAQADQEQGKKQWPLPQSQAEQTAAKLPPEQHAPAPAPHERQQPEHAAQHQSAQREQQQEQQRVNYQQHEQQRVNHQQQEQQQRQQEPGSAEAALPAAAVAAAAVEPSLLADIIDLTADDEGGDPGAAPASGAAPAGAASAAAGSPAGGGPDSAAAAGWGALFRRALHNASEFVRAVVQGAGQVALKPEDLQVLHVASQRAQDPDERQAAAVAIRGLAQAGQAIRAWQQQQYAAALQQQQQQQYAAALQQQQQQQQQWASATVTTGGAGALGAQQQQQQQLGYSLAGFGLAYRGAAATGPAAPSGTTVVGGSPLAATRVDKEQAVRAAMEGLETAGSGSEERQPPEGLLLTPLLRHQRIALAWMCRRETAGQQPVGGILADDQGLGKTVSTISLIVSNRPSPKHQGQLARLAGSSTSLAASASQQEGRKRRRHDASGAGAPAAAGGSAAGSRDTLGSSSIESGGGSSSDEYPSDSSDEEVEEVANGGGAGKRRASAAPTSSGDVVCLDSDEGEEAEETGLAGGTLVVCPTTVLHQWASEIRAKVNPNAGMTVHVYHGKGKAVSAGTLSRFGVVLTTFQTMALEAPKRDAASAPGGGKKASGAGAGTPAAASASAAAAAAAAAGVAFDDDFVDLLSDSEEAADAAAPAGKRHKGPAGARPAGGGAAEGARAKPAAGGGPLYEIMWHRVVLDEAQCIKNPRTLAAHAAWSLRARARWCLSGTPLQNTLDDLYSYFRFLRYEPYCRKERFNEMLRDPIAAGGAQGQRGLQRLHTVLKGVMLRRTKQSQLDGKPIIDLPPRKLQLLRAKLSPAERQFYDRLKTEASAEFRRLQQQNGGVGQHYVGVLWQLLRLRQACNHPLLVKGADGLAAQQPVAAAELAAARRLVPHLRAHLAELLSPQRLEPCAVCGDMPEDAVAAVCSHVFCAQCVATQLSNAGHGAAEAELAFHCPACRQALGRHDTFTAAALAAAAQPAAAVPEQQVQQQQEEGQQGQASEPGQPPCDGPQQAVAGAAAAAAANGGQQAAGPAGAGSPVRWQSSAKLDALMDMLRKLRDKGAAAEAEAKAQRSVLTSGRSLSHARLAAALGGGAAAARKPSRGAGAGGRGAGAGAGARAGGSRGASPRLPMEKVIVFSQWTAMLDLAEAPLRREGFQFRRLDGTMNIKARQQAIEDFSRRPEVAVMLVSLKAASLGVNLVSANHVVLMDLWYNPTVEEQAIDRAHRIGQTRPVHVTRITIEDSIEDQILKLQDRKRATIAQALQEGSGAGGLAAFSSRLTQQELNELFDDVARAR